MVLQDTNLGTGNVERSGEVTAVRLLRKNVAMSE